MANKFKPSEKESLKRILEIAKSNIGLNQSYDMECLENVTNFVKYYDEIMASHGYETEEA
jgi:hypothetical protein